MMRGQLVPVSVAAHNAPVIGLDHLSFQPAEMFGVVIPRPVFPGVAAVQQSDGYVHG